MKKKSFIKSLIISVISSAAIAGGLLLASFCKFKSTGHMLFERTISGGEYQATKGYGLIKETIYGMGQNPKNHTSVSIIYSDVLKTFILFVIIFIIISTIKYYIDKRKS